MRRALIAVVAAALFPGMAEARVPVRQSFARALGCGPHGTATVTGRLSAAIAPRLRIRWSGRRVRAARAVATLTGGVDLGVEASGGAACRLEPTPIARWNAPPLRFAAGPVPVVVVPRVTVYLSAEARATQPVATRIRGSLEATTGLRYDGRVHRIGRLSERLTGDPALGRSSASIGARVTPSLELLLYGQAGPRFDFGTGLELDSGPPRRLSVPVELAAGLHLPGLDVGPLTVLARRIRLTGRASTPAAPAPLERARIEWDTPADIDLHVWDERGRHASYRESAIPGVVLSKDDTDGFGPETLVEDAPGARSFRYGLCFFDARGAGPTQVTARLTDASGETRAITRTLAAEGDSAFIGPAGSEPARGWCQARH